MLVLSRKSTQSIVVNGDIRITVVSIRGNQVRLGFEAPGSIAIVREELCDPARARRQQPVRHRRRVRSKGGVRLDHHRRRERNRAARREAIESQEPFCWEHNPCCAAS